MAATLQESGRIGLAIAVASQPLHLAWGRGSPAWDSAPESPPGNANALTDEIGRRLISDIGYAEPSPTGEIELPSGERYARVPGPTPYVHVRVTFDFADAEGETIRELGLTMGAQTAAGLPAGQRYFSPSQVTAPGRMYMIERVGFFVRSGAVRQFFEYILPF